MEESIYAQRSVSKEKVKNNYYERINIRYIIYLEQILRKNSCAAPYVQNENNFVFIVYAVFVSS